MNSLEQQIQSCTELELFQIIYDLGGYLFYTRHDLADGRYKSTPEIECSLVIAQEKIKTAVAQVQRFGVESLLRDDGSATKGYWSWYNDTKHSYDSLSDDAIADLNVDFKIEI